MGITIITCTGDRPTPFDLCVKYMARQTRRPDQWVIVDDGATPLDIDAGRLAEQCGIREVQIVRRLPRSDDPPHTLPVNLLAALKHVSNPKVAFVEDDDWYGPEHLAAIDDGLELHGLAGFRGIVYYHVGKRCHKTMGEASPHSSLCQTGLTRKAFPTLERICSRRGMFVDLQLWKEFAGAKQLWENQNTVVGIKGLPGRPGLTAGWRSVNSYTPDPSLTYLESLIGEDVANYGG